ncbi:MAG: DUF1924 domain-containing protein [Alphaproteobacteria bacterium]|nr:DUF1924 domain-containing protein [Rhodospirillales bacterium]MCW9046171.1 DUF1924 domain-containing protein [Alphaproteobacteria bacterium]
MKTSFFKQFQLLSIAMVVTVGVAPNAGTAAEIPEKIIANYFSSAKSSDASIDSFSADRGRKLFLSNPATGKPDTPSCTSCHSNSPMNQGQTRAGKDIAPMALSKTPNRYVDIKKVEKWFRRNCKSVLGRTCTPLEKGDFLTFMISQ